MYKGIVALGNVCLIINEKIRKFRCGSNSGQMTFWVGHVTMFTRCDTSLYELQIFKRDAGRYRPRKQSDGPSRLAGIPGPNISCNDFGFKLLGSNVSAARGTYKF